MPQGHLEVAPRLYHLNYVDFLVQGVDRFLNALLFAITLATDAALGQVVHQVIPDVPSPRWLEEVGPVEVALIRNCVRVLLLQLEESRGHVRIKMIVVDYVEETCQDAYQNGLNTATV